MKIRIHTFLLLGIVLFQFSCAQENTKNSKAQAFPFTDTNWTVQNADGSVAEIKTLDYKGKQALQLEASQSAYLTGKKYRNFVMEFYCNGSLPGFRFRVVDNKNYEYVYLRVPMSKKRDALQYLPIYNGSLPWQLYNYPKYEGKATFPREQIATLPLSFEDEMVTGKISEKLLNALEDVGISFSKESDINITNETMQYIFDTQNKNVVLFEKLDDAISFLDFRTWIRTKVEVLDHKMLVYIEDMETPTFVVDNLKRDAEEGGISLISNFDQVYFSDFSVTEIEANEASKNSLNKKSLSPNYLTKWEVSEMFSKDSINFISQVDSLFENKGKFKSILADDDGLLNISRFYDDMTKTVALSCIIISDSDKTVGLNFDYADHLVILLNSQVLFDMGMNFQAPPEKGEEGRVFVDDEYVELNLSKGSNNLIFVLSADNRQKYNWGCIAKLKNLEGIKIE